MTVSLNSLAGNYLATFHYGIFFFEGSGFCSFIWDIFLCLVIVFDFLYLFI